MSDFVEVEIETEGTVTETYEDDISSDTVSPAAAFSVQQSDLDDLEDSEIVTYSEVVAEDEQISNDVTYNVSLLFVLSLIVGLFTFHILSRRWTA
jgi:hypothetical protein